ncbi:MAG: DUF1778 domain-containing protein [Solirubrobacteraceae bacterium]
MTRTLTIRLSEADRAVLESAARARGEGVSTLVRDLATAEARRLRLAAVREQLDRFSALASDDPQLSAEMEAMTSGQPEWPGWSGDLPAAWLDGTP